jgi:hypothetical protein
MRLPNARDLTVADLMIALAGATVILALLLPTLRARSFRASVERTVSEVEAVRRAAESHFRTRATWPLAEAAGVTPPALTGILGDDLVRDGYTLQWTRWSVVDSVETPRAPVETVPGDAPPDDAPRAATPLVQLIGAVVVYSGDDRLLGELLARYGRDASFVRDTTWTLVLPERARRY